MEIVLDTSVVIGYLRDHGPEAELVERLLDGHRVYVTAITTYELEVGFDRGSKQSEAAQTLLEALHVLPLDAPGAMRAGGLERDLRRIGRSIGAADVLIAGICLHNQKRLLTLNRRHFDQIADLVVVSPRELRL